MLKLKKSDIYKRLIFCYSLSCFAEWILLPIYAIYVQQIWWDILDASWAMAIFLITSGLITIFIHKIQWSSKQKSILFIGWRFIWLLWICMYMIVDSVVLLFITQVVIAIGNAMANPIFDKELEDNSNTNNSTFKRWLYEGSQDIVNGIAAIVWWIIVTTIGFKSLIILMIIIAWLSFVGIVYYHKILRFTLE